jgi:hypothetical protein
MSPIDFVQTKENKCPGRRSFRYLCAAGEACVTRVDLHPVGDLVTTPHALILVLCIGINASYVTLRCLSVAVYRAVLNMHANQMITGKASAVHVDRFPRVTARLRYLRAAARCQCPLF